MYKDAKIYVAGHRGLLGSALLRRLRADGYTKILTKTHAELDLTQQAAVDDFFRRERPEYVFLCAGLTGGIHANKTQPATFLQTNVMIQACLFEAAQRYEAKHLLFYGSSCIYPKNSAQPMKEQYLLTGEIEATSEAYAVAKMAGIIACRSFNAQYNTNRFIALVPNSMYGPYDNFSVENSHVLSALIRRFHDAKAAGDASITLWGSGAPKREFIFSEDVADASIFCMQNAARLQNSHYNLGTGTDYSIRELAAMVAELVGFTGEVRWDTAKPDGTARKLLDSSRFLSLGWKPTVTLKAGLERTYQWYRENQATPAAQRTAHG
jgi:GDP-L-fucose synthase